MDREIPNAVHERSHPRCVNINKLPRESYLFRRQRNASVAYRFSIQRVIYLVRFVRLDAEKLSEA